MSLTGNIDHLVHAQGVQAALVRTEENPETFRGEDQWKQTLGKALDVFALTGESSVRMVVGKYTLVVQRERHETVAVALPTGHPMAKSLRRMLRRMSRKDRGPLATATVAEATATPPGPLSDGLSRQNRGGLINERPGLGSSHFSF